MNLQQLDKQLADIEAKAVNLSVSLLGYAELAQELHRTIRAARQGKTLEELQEELSGVVRRGRPRNDVAADSAGQKPRKPRQQSEASRKAQGEKMRAYWAERRANAAKSAKARNAATAPKAKRSKKVAK